MPKYHEFNVFDGAGKQLSHSVYVKKNSLGGGWVAFYKKALKRLIKECPTFSILKVWLQLAGKQTFQKFVMTTQSQLAKELGMDPSTVQKAVKWLRDNGYVQTHMLEGNYAFLLSPMKTSCGAGNRTSRQELWDLKAQREEVDKLELEAERRKELIENLDKLIAERVTEELPEERLEEEEFDEEDS